MVVITISGAPGSGKSTIAQLLHEKLKLRYVYSGMIFRETAEKYKMTLEEFGKFCEENSKVDKELDYKQVEILKKDDVIVEGRLAGWLAYRNKIPAFKIMIKADVDTRAKRIVKREQGNVKERKKEIIERERSETDRYKRYYDIDLSDTSIYDLVIDSSDKNSEEVLKIIMEKLT